MMCLVKNIRLIDLQNANKSLETRKKLLTSANFLVEFKDIFIHANHQRNMSTHPQFSWYAKVVNITDR